MSEPERTFVDLYASEGKKVNYTDLKKSLITNNGSIEIDLNGNRGELANFTSLKLESHPEAGRNLLKASEDLVLGLVPRYDSIDMSSEIDRLRDVLRGRLREAGMEHEDIPAVVRSVENTAAKTLKDHGIDISQSINLGGS